MKSLFCCAFLLCLLSVAQAAEQTFTQTLTPEELKASGLDRLLPAERAFLDTLIARSQQASVSQHSKEVLEAKQRAAAALAAQQAAEAAEKAARVEAESAKEEAKKVAVAGGKTGEKGFWSKAKVYLVPGTKVEYVEIRSKIEGTFEGWSGRTTFKLANGQRWQVANSDERFFVPPTQGVEVEIYPASLGGYWMYVRAFDAQVRVKLLGGQ